MKRALRLIESPQDALSRLLEEKAALEKALRAVDALIAEQGRDLAKIRGVAFIRFEQLRQEFGAA